MIVKKYDLTLKVPDECPACGQRIISVHVSFDIEIDPPDDPYDTLELTCSECGGDITHDMQVSVEPAA